jgi:hypothetical protein
MQFWGDGFSGDRGWGLVPEILKTLASMKMHDFKWKALPADPKENWTLCLGVE